LAISEGLLAGRPQQTSVNATVDAIVLVVGGAARCGLG
jgi:hypothetical protein